MDGELAPEEFNGAQPRPVNLRCGRRTVVTLPSGEEVAFEPDRDEGHFRLMVIVPPGARIEHLQ